jgi:hypothetical protein
MLADPAPTRSVGAGSYSKKRDKAAAYPTWRRHTRPIDSNR